MERLNEIICNVLRTRNALMNSIVSHYLAARGKQLRPMLTVLSGLLHGGVDESVLNAGAAIEILHNASLIHDDVIDRSKERRGNATINSVWDNHVAVLVGDFFITNALRCAMRTQNIRVLDILSNLGSDLALGEIDQVDTARNRDIDEATYMRIIEQKTASLFTSCVLVGGMARGVEPEVIEPLREFARLLGVCFQIKDDTFDYFDDPVIGKPTGNDLREGKITLPLIYALSLTDHPEHDAMVTLAHKPVLSEDDINVLVNFAKDNGGIDYAYDKMNRLRQEAEKHLEAYPDGFEINAMKAIFGFIIERKK